MSNSVDILIKADDQASAKLQKVENSLDGTVSKFQQTGKRAKSAADAMAAFASVSGDSALAGLAGQLAGVTEKLSGFAEAAKNGGTASLGFQAGLVGIVGVAAFEFGKVIADIIWQTELFEQQVAAVNRQAERLDKSVAGLQSRMMANAREDIELIQDPAEKQAAYQALIADLNKNIEGLAGNVANSRKEVEKWATSWKITGDQKQYYEDAKNQLKADEDRLQLLKDERDEIARNTGERAKNIAAIKEANATKERSRAYLEDLNREVEYLKASKEERRAMDALKNAPTDTGEAERLLAERDAILAKQEAEKQAAEERKRQLDEVQQKAKQIKQEREREKQQIEQLKASERERLDLLRIEIEQGKEAARVKEMMSKGVDEQTAKQLVAEQARLDKLQAAKAKQDEFQKNLQTTGGAQKLTANESRLLTRGTSEDQSTALQRQMVAALTQIQAYAQISADAGMVTKDQIITVAENTGKTTQIAMPK